MVKDKTFCSHKGIEKTHLYIVGKFFLKQNKTKQIHEFGTKHIQGQNIHFFFQIHIIVTQ